MFWSPFLDLQLSLIFKYQVDKDRYVMFLSQSVKHIYLTFACLLKGQLKFYEKVKLLYGPYWLSQQSAIYLVFPKPPSGEYRIYSLVWRAEMINDSFQNTEAQVRSYVSDFKCSYASTILETTSSSTSRLPSGVWGMSCVITYINFS